MESRRADKYQPNVSIASSFDKPTSIPLQIINNKIYLPVNLGQGIEGKFILDTGASTTIISPDMADLLGIVIGNDTIRRTFSVIGGQTMAIPVVCLPGIKVGQAVVNNLSVGVSVIHPDAPVIDGLLGADFLGHFKMTLDHNASRLILSPHEIDHKRRESTKRPSFVWTETRTPLYTSPSQKRQIKKLLPAGTKIKVQSVIDNWYSVSTDLNVMNRLPEGWIEKDLVSEEEPGNPKTSQ